MPDVRDAFASFRTVTMISRCIAFLAAALLLANCCGLGNGCAPTAEAPLAWDGLGSAPTEDAPPMELKPKKHAGAEREIVDRRRDTAAAEPNQRLQPKDDWDERHAAEKVEEAKLKRKLIICSTCGGESARSETFAR
jgi:hypothetical protein